MSKTKQPASFKAGVVALVGPPNAGKSTFLNFVLGQKVSIVSPKPQTTRNNISGILTLENGQIVFLDTPGIHIGRSQLNRHIVAAAWQALSSADLVVLMLDASLYQKDPSFLDKQIKPFLGPLTPKGSQLFLALNKVDRIKDKTSLLPIMDRLRSPWPDLQTFPISARTGLGTQELVNGIMAALPEAPPYFPEDQISTAPLRFMATEIIREKLFLNLREELPYSVAVDIETWEEDDRLAKIQAVIFVSRDNHKGIVLGKRGAMLKEVGTLARLEIAELLEKKVFLSLFVKVRTGWPEDPSSLADLGIGKEYGL